MRLFGVNGVGHESGNDAVTEGRDTPWLQDTVEADVWTLWGVEYRDVVVLDEGHAVVGVLNLTDHDLADAQTEGELRELLLLDQ